MPRVLAYGLRRRPTKFGTRLNRTIETRYASHSEDSEDHILHLAVGTSSRGSYGTASDSRSTTNSQVLHFNTF